MGGVRSAAHTRFARVRDRLERLTPPPGSPSRPYEFALFVFKQGWACLFGGLMLALLLGTHLFYPADASLGRYDFLTLAALAIQAAMLAFHIVGTVMELFKTGAGSWIYPEPSLLRIGGVPLFSGFMYAAVGSYLARVWRIFDFGFDRYPNGRGQHCLESRSTSISSPTTGCRTSVWRRHLDEKDGTKGPWPTKCVRAQAFRRQSFI